MHLNYIIVSIFSQVATQLKLKSIMRQKQGPDKHLQFQEHCLVVGNTWSRANYPKSQCRSVKNGRAVGSPDTNTNL